MRTFTPSQAAQTPGEARKNPASGRPWRTLVAALLALSTLAMVGYTAVSIYIGTQVQVEPRMAIYATPASLGLQYKDVSFPSRGDNVQLRGWFIPGALPDGRLTTQRTIMILHGNTTNRADQNIGLLNLSGDLARRGFAILAFDFRGTGESPAAPRSFGLFEQRDVLGAVDFLRSGALPYPELGRTRAIGGWGMSLGGASLIFAAAQEQAIRAVVSDSTYADILPVLEREIPREGHLPAFFTPGGLIAAQVLYGVDYYHTRPVEAVASIAPRPLFFIQMANDDYTPSSNLTMLADAARAAPDAHVQTWLVPGTKHANTYLTAGNAYVDRVAAFFTTALGPDSGAS